MFKDPQPAVRSVDPVTEAGADRGNTPVKVFKDPQPAVRSVNPVAEAGADGGNASVMVPEVYQGSLIRSRANRV